MTDGSAAVGASEGRIVVDGAPVGFEAGDSVAIAIVRARSVPGHGGCLCLTGDCGNCLAEVDGVAYVLTWQVAARPGTVVRRHPREGKPQLPVIDLNDLGRTPVGSEVAVRRAHAERVVIGSTAGSPPDTTVLDAATGIEVVGIYPGPSVIAREPSGMLHLTADEIVVATGAAELQPVCEGSGLAGIVTAGAAARLQEAGVDPGRTVRVGRELVRFEGNDDGRVAAIVTRAADGSETRTECDTAVVELGRSPRDLLARMTAEPGVTAAVSVTNKQTLKPATTADDVCP